MKTIFPLAALAALVLAAPAWSQTPVAKSPIVKSPIEGRWAKGDLHIDIAPCGSALCGTVVAASPNQQAKAMRGSGTKLIGATLIHDIRPIGPGRYKARVYAPDRNIHASGTISQVAAGRIDVSGCVAFILCKTAHWTRVAR